MNLLYVYKQRIPLNLRQLILDNIPQDEFDVETMTYAMSQGEQCQRMRWADVVLFAPGRYLPEVIFCNAPHVKLMQLWSAGYDHFNIEAARRHGIPVANNGGANAASVAEHTIMLMLAVYKWLPDSHRRTIEGRWRGNSHGMDMFLLQNKVLGLVGFGNIGRQVARRASAFGMRILYCDPAWAPYKFFVDLGAEYYELDKLLATADIVSLHLPLNESTAGMIGNRELGLMKESAVLINTSRARLVDNDALLAVLNERRLWGAGLDVHMEEPTKANDPLLTHPHVVATPHMAGCSYDAYITTMKHCIDNFRRVRDGEKPLWVVNSIE